MTIRFRTLIALSALAGLAAAYVPRATAGEAPRYQCWRDPALDPPTACPVCEGACQGGPCCIIDASVA